MCVYSSYLRKVSSAKNEEYFIFDLYVLIYFLDMQDKESDLYGSHSLRSERKEGTFLSHRKNTILFPSFCPHLDVYDISVCPFKRYMHDDVRLVILKSIQYFLFFSFFSSTYSVQMVTHRERLLPSQKQKGGKTCFYRSILYDSHREQQFIIQRQYRRKETNDNGWHMI